MLRQGTFEGELIDNRYHLQEELGRGAFGLVYAAVEETLAEAVSRCAVKLILPQDPDHLESITREIRALAGLSHPNVVAYRTSGVVQTGRLTGWVFVVTELAQRSLESVIEARTPVDPRTLREVTRDVATGLEYIHRQRAIHRDIKPANILLVNGTWKISDFGLARPFDQTLIKGSATCGTFAYMAPEAFRAQVGPATDVYALGVTLLRALTGRLAHSGDGAEFISNLLKHPANIPPGLPEPWCRILPRCLEQDPSARCTAREILALLEGTSSAAPVGGRAVGNSHAGSSVRGGSRAGIGGTARSPGNATTVGPGGQVAPTVHAGVSRHWPWLMVLLAAVLWIGWPRLTTGSHSAPPGPGLGPGRQSSAKELTLRDAELSYRARDYSRAETIAAALTRRNGRDGAAWRLLGAVSLVGSRAREGEQRYRRALDADPSDAEAWLGYGQCLEEQGKQVEASRAYRTAFDYAGDDGELRAVAQEGLRRAR